MIGVQSLPRYILRNDLTQSSFQEREVKKAANPAAFPPSQLQDGTTSSTQSFVTNAPIQRVKVQPDHGSDLQHASDAKLLSNQAAAASTAEGEIFADNDLVQRAKQGEREAFRLLVERYQQRSHAIAYGIVGNFDDAQDVVQEAFIKAHRNLSLFRGQSSFYTWLYRIVFNLSIDLSRKRYRHVESSVGDMRALDTSAQTSRSSAEALMGHVGTAEENFERKELSGRIQSAIERLTPEHRAVIMLREIDGLSYTEISDAIGCSKGTVMSRLHHARRRLQEALKDFRPLGLRAHSETEKDEDLETEGDVL